MKLVIGNKNYSTWSLRPWLLLSAFDVPFEEVNESLLSDGLKERLGKYSPTALVPVLLDGDLSVWDSLAICEYVSEQYLAGRGWPTALDVRAQARALTCEMHTGFGALRNEMPMNCRAFRKITLSDAASANVRRIDQIWSEFPARSASGEGWLFGEFSIADCFYAPVALRLPTYQVALSVEAEAYASRLRALPAMRAWVEASAFESEVIPEDEVGEDVRG